MTENDAFNMPFHKVLHFREGGVYKDWWPAAMRDHFMNSRIDVALPYEGSDWDVIQMGMSFNGQDHSLFKLLCQSALGQSECSIMDNVWGFSSHFSLVNPHPVSLPGFPSKRIEVGSDDWSWMVETFRSGIPAEPYIWDATWHHVESGDPFDGAPHYLCFPTKSERFQSEIMMAKMRLGITG